MRICVFGTGAVGGYLAARLLQAGSHEVSVVARGEQLRAITRDGLTLIEPDGQQVVHAAYATDQPHTMPPQDLVFVTLKAHALPAAASAIACLLGSRGSAVFVNNGIPWWWHHHGHANPGESLPLLDPNGALWNTVTPQRAIGCVVYSANEVVRPGVVQHTANNQWWLGEPDGTLSERLLATAHLMREVSLNAEAVPDIRAQVWAKLLRNAPMNGLSALTRLDVGALAREPGLLSLFEALVDEVAAVATAHGVDLSARVAMAKAAPRLGGAVDGSAAPPVRPSMLQDIELGRAMEVEPILGQLLAFAQTRATRTPVLSMLVPLLRGLNRTTQVTSAPNKARP